jgi:hypothetical protein
VGELSISCFSEAGRSIFRARAAIPLNASSAKASKATEFERTIPRTKLFLGELVDTASLLDRDPAATHGRDHRGLAADDPPLGVRTWQLLQKPRPGHRITGRRFH